MVLLSINCGAIGSGSEVVDGNRRTRKARNCSEKHGVPRLRKTQDAQIAAFGFSAADGAAAVWALPVGVPDLSQDANGALSGQEAIERVAKPLSAESGLRGIDSEIHAICRLLSCERSFWGGIFFAAGFLRSS